MATDGGGRADTRAATDRSPACALSRHPHQAAPQTRQAPPAAPPPGKAGLSHWCCRAAGCPSPISPLPTLQGKVTKAVLFCSDSPVTQNRRV